MSATLLTPNYALPYYQDGDTLNFTDYNNSMLKIDTGMTQNKDAGTQNSGQISELQTTADNLTTNVNKLQETANTNVTDILNLKTQQNNIEHHVEDLETEINGAQTNIEQLQDSINNTLSPELTTVKNDVTKLQQDTATNATSIENLETNQTGLQTSISNLTTSVTTLETETANMKNNINDNSTSISQLETANNNNIIKINSLTDSMVDVRTSLQSLENSFNNKKYTLIRFDNITGAQVTDSSITLPSNVSGGLLKIKLYNNDNITGTIGNMYIYLTSNFGSNNNQSGIFSVDASCYTKQGSSNLPLFSPVSCTLLNGKPTLVCTFLVPSDLTLYIEYYYDPSKNLSIGFEESSTTIVGNIGYYK